ncbi:MAG TPA: glycosyl hydrolase, partial [Bacteroidota bacterium]|nr:glycosyl hydrolase [Bacteroidota bacterium]
MNRFLLLALVALPLFVRPAVARDDDADKPSAKDPFSSETFKGLRFRSIGPAVTSGRVSDIAVDPRNRSRYFVAAASGGVWKTVNAGTTFEPVFDGEGSYSIGCVAIDPENSSIVWVGTGEYNSQRSVSYGDGVYRSGDGGKSWENVGLKASEHIGKIVIDPRNSAVVYVAAQGPLWGPGGDRGLYKTADAGKTWTLVLKISENTGVSDVVMDPRNPDVLFASSYQRRRHVWTLIDGGPEGAIYKSTDAGASWKKLTKGIPDEDKGRIGLAISVTHPDTVYAVIELANGKGGFYRSMDRGESWEKR